MPSLGNLDHSIVTEDVLFRAGQYQLHGELAYPETGRARGAVVIAGPHPLLGGNLRNNVVRGIGDGLARRGLLTLRFDYRGAGRSEGPRLDVARHLAEFWRTSHVSGEMDFWQDVQAAVDFVEQAVPGLPLALAGYSFGCALLPYVKSQQDLAALVLIAPTVAKHDFASFRAVSTPLFVVASEDDFATDGQCLQDWFDSLTMPRQVLRQRCDNHFFRGHEDGLADTVGNFLAPYLGEHA